MSTQYKELPQSNAGGASSNASVGLTGVTAPTSATEIGGVDPFGVLRPVSVDVVGRLNVSTTGDVNALTLETGTFAYSYNEAPVVPAAVLTTITSYVAGGPTRMKRVDVSGTNIATFTVVVNGMNISKKQSFYGYLDNSFDYSKGFPLSALDVVEIQVIQNQTSPGDFSAFILLLKDY